VLAQGTPDEISRATGASSLEDAFVTLLAQPPQVP
jgi:hypothetical protein